MDCMICAGRMLLYFSKEFDSSVLGRVEYHRCDGCGFCASKTHQDMPEADWVRLNTEWHEANNRRAENPWGREKRHFNQALMLHLLSRHGLAPEGCWLDYASGQAGLSKQLRVQFGEELYSFDKFIRPESLPILESDLQKRNYNLVVNTAMFEHVRDRATLDEVESYVAEEGCLAVHTLVRGEIPADPDWMYLLPVHCAFFTNRSMDILMRQWGYSCSIYSEQAKMWIWFKTEPGMVARKAAALNKSLGWEYLHFKQGFMDYWP